MQIKEWLTASSAVLANSTTPRLDVEILLGHVAGHTRAEVVLHEDDTLTPAQLSRLDDLLGQRVQGVPLAYLVGHQEFLDFELGVTPDVLIPRPETETIVHATIDLANKMHPDTIYEIGTGSGAIAIGLAHALPDTKIIASDISKSALEVADRNIDHYKLGDRIELVQSDLGDHINHATLLVANLPYLPVGLLVSPNVQHEPDVALWSGEDGLDHYRKLFTTTKFDTAVIELGADQYQPLAEWVARHLSGKDISPILTIDGLVCGMVIGQAKMLAD